MVNFFMGIIKIICWTMLIIIGVVGFAVLMIPFALAAAILALSLPWIIILGVADNSTPFETTGKISTGKTSQFKDRK